MWLQVLKLLGDALQEVGAETAIAYGAQNPLEIMSNHEEAIVLVRGNEEKSTARSVEVTNVNMYLGAFTREDNTYEEGYLLGYKRLAELEGRIDDVLHQLRSAITELQPICALDNGYQVMDISITSKTGDLDVMRPILGTQYNIKVMVYNHNERIW